MKNKDSWQSSDSFLGYFLALLYMILIGMLFLCLDGLAGISDSFAWLVCFFMLGFLASLIPTYRQGRSIKCFMGCIVLFALFSAGIATLCDVGQSGSDAKFRRLDNSIQPGMSVEEVEGLMARAFPGIRPSMSLNDHGHIQTEANVMKITVKDGVVVTRSHIDD